MIKLFSLNKMKKLKKSDRIKKGNTEIRKTRTTLTGKSRKIFVKGYYRKK